jgi:hypothetical protein
MENGMEYLYLGSLAFTNFVILDFFIIELVLRLGVFTLGKKWVRISLILAIQVESWCMYLYNALPSNNMPFFTGMGVSWMAWNPLYYYMLIEQNTYWMEYKIRIRLLISLAVFTCWVIFEGIACILVGNEIVSESFMIYPDIVDIFLFVQLVSTELFINYKVWKVSKKKLIGISPKIWTKVKFSIFICTMCTLMDILFIVLENMNRYDIAFQIKTSSFAFKIVFECLCFQFIKGLIFSLNN